MNNNLDAKALVKDPVPLALVGLSALLMAAMWALAQASVHFGDPR